MVLLADAAVASTSVDPRWILAGAVVSLGVGALSIAKLALEIKKLVRELAPTDAAASVDTPSESADISRTASLMRSRHAIMLVGVLTVVPWIGLSVTMWRWWIYYRAYDKVGQQVASIIASCREFDNKLRAQLTTAEASRDAATAELKREHERTHRCVSKAPFSAHSSVTIPVEECRSLASGRAKVTFSFTIRETTNKKDVVRPVWKYSIGAVRGVLPNPPAPFGPIRMGQKHQKELYLKYFAGGDTAIFVQLARCDTGDVSDECAGFVEVEVVVE